MAHTYDAFVEFPDGRLAVPVFDPGLTPWDFAADIRFMLDRIEELAGGCNPDSRHRPLPAGLGAALDPHRIGMFGWSKGATATALVMGEDRRVRAGLSFDGPMQAQPPVNADLDRPFMLMTAEKTRAAEPSVAEFWSHLRGWRLNVQASGAAHTSYCDFQWLIPQVAKATGMSDEDLQSWIGTLDPARGLRIQQAYPLAFFDLHLRRRGHLPLAWRRPPGTTIRPVRGPRPAGLVSQPARAGGWRSCGSVIEADRPVRRRRRSRYTSGTGACPRRRTSSRPGSG
ncbi:MAG: hypothetical protein AUG49_04365 [Catenulispora sp. 13_1_20CM_3_70_7]|nr:MAG: hypothetical protein AUG49_04365 [Catenulispora sp. 13_1_20CM_3_70_7]